MKRADARIWAASSPTEARRRNARFKNWARPAALMRPGRHVMVLQETHEGVRELFNFSKKILRLQDNQVIWTPGSPAAGCLDTDIDDAVLRQINAQVVAARSDESFAVVPNSVSAKMLRWANKLEGGNVKVVAERPHSIAHHGDCKVLFRAASDPQAPAPVEGWLPDCRVVRGWRCRTAEEAVAAYKLLGELGSSGALIVPVLAREGQDIREVESEEELRLYGFNFGEIARQENPALDRGPDRLPIRLSLTFLKNEVFGQGGRDTETVTKLGMRYLAECDSEVVRCRCSQLEALPRIHLGSLGAPTRRPSMAVTLTGRSLAVARN